MKSSPAFGCEISPRPEPMNSRTMSNKDEEVQYTYCKNEYDYSSHINRGSKLNIYINAVFVQFFSNTYKKNLLCPYCNKCFVGLPVSAKKCKSSVSLSVPLGCIEAIHWTTDELLCVIKVRRQFYMYLKTAFNYLFLTLIYLLKSP